MRKVRRINALLKDRKKNPLHQSMATLLLLIDLFDERFVQIKIESIVMVAVLFSIIFDDDDILN